MKGAYFYFFEWVAIRTDKEESNSYELAVSLNNICILIRDTKFNVLCLMMTGQLIANYSERINRRHENLSDVLPISFVYFCPSRERQAAPFHKKAMPPFQHPFLLRKRNLFPLDFISLLLPYLLQQGLPHCYYPTAFRITFNESGLDVTLRQFLCPVMINYVRSQKCGFCPKMVIYWVLMFPFFSALGLINQKHTYFPFSFLHNRLEGKEREQEKNKIEERESMFFLHFVWQELSPGCKKHVHSNKTPSHLDLKMTWAVKIAPTRKLNVNIEFVEQFSRENILPKNCPLVLTGLHFSCINCSREIQPFPIRVKDRKSGTSWESLKLAEMTFFSPYNSKSLKYNCFPI